MTCSPSARDSPSARMRATRSLGPPAGKPWMMVIGRSGQSAARADVAARAATPARTVRRVTAGMGASFLDAPRLYLDLPRLYRTARARAVVFWPAFRLYFGI